MWETTIASHVLAVAFGRVRLPSFASPTHPATTFTAQTPNYPTNQSPASSPQSTNDSPGEETGHSTESQESGICADPRLSSPSLEKYFPTIMFATTCIDVAFAENYSRKAHNGNASQDPPKGIGGEGQSARAQVRHKYA